MNSIKQYAVVATSM